MEYEKILFEDFNENDYVEKSVKNLKDGDKVAIVGKLELVKQKTRNNDDYINAKVVDSKGSISQNIWKNLPIFEKISYKQDNGKIAKVFGKIVVNGIYKNIEIDNIAFINTETTKSLETSPSVDVLKTELKNRITNIANPFLRDLVSSTISIPEVLELLFVSPATEMTAYSYLGGVAHLMIDTIDTVNNVVNNINENFWNSSLKLDLDLLVSSVILSNVGRLFTLEIDEDNNIEKTLKGSLESDAIISRDIVSKEIDKLLLKTNKDGSKMYNDCDELILELLHIISSNRGRVEFGASTIPRSKHSIILSSINQIVYTKGLFEAMERENVLNDKFSRSYENGKNYYLG